MRINTNYFCSLSSHPHFLGWLRDFAVDLHDNLVAQQKNGGGCRANTERMLAILDTIKQRGGEQSLISFLRMHFPHTIDVVAPSTIVPTSVFENYSPGLLTIPRRMVFQAEDDARNFLADKPFGEYIIVDGQVYVEYLPIELAHLADQIPAENWRVRVWRQTH